MSLVAAILFKYPPPEFHGTVRNIKAPEMLAPVISHYKFNKHTGPNSTCSRDRGHVMHQKIKALFATGEGFTISDIMQKVGASEASAYRHVNSMIVDGNITRKKMGGKFRYSGI